VEWGWRIRGDGRPGGCTPAVCACMGAQWGKCIRALRSEGAVSVRSGGGGGGARSPGSEVYPPSAAHSARQGTQGWGVQATAAGMLHGTTANSTTPIQCEGQPPRPPACAQHAPPVVQQSRSASLENRKRWNRRNRFRFFPPRTRSCECAPKVGFQSRPALDTERICVCAASSSVPFPCCLNPQTPLLTLQPP